MQRTPLEQLKGIKSYLRQTSNYEGKTVEEIRNGMADAAAALPQLPDIMFERVAIGHLKGEWVSSVDNNPETEKQVILYLHGGGFISGTCEFYRDLASRISKASGVKVLTLEYRLAPEYPYPAANEDCLSAYSWLMENGFTPHNIILGGDSVGGSLALMTLLSLRDANEVLPAGAFLISPHTDLVHLDGESYQSRAELDPSGSIQTNQRILSAYLGDVSQEVPLLLSPLRMDLKGLPPLFIQVGDHEVLLCDATRCADLARDAGVEVTLEVWDNMWSVFHFLAYMLPEAQHAITNIGQFVRTTLINQ
ncbi:alpha/beta hydrolase [Paenibacillus glacialis]|uniref:Alpha/beta hydrolase fold-3 domain-containing protein n=1 Tax=Paenibacillus glacialis TaxID=494026 RepID=A0A168M7N0_9BACL|nr:alpha/beta hydrolase [Paenibacillus glacialis]OAB44331.1 hypothetical protein PGLA_06625 [Paenibacillus glacialis]